VQTGGPVSLWITLKGVSGYRMVRWPDGSLAGRTGGEGRSSRDEPAVGWKLA
jgi:hypothetical protein